MRCLEYNVEEFLVSCVDKYRELVPGFKLRKVAAPFIPDPTPTPMAPITSWEAAIENTPAARCESGQPQPIAAQTLMKVLYAARMARLDLLRAVNFLAAQITKWSPRCDRRLDRLMCYIWSSLELRQIAWCNDTVENMRVHLYVDADFAGCLETSRSTSGVYLCIQGPGTAFPYCRFFEATGQCVS